MIRMKHQVAIVGAGVSGLTCGLVFAQHGYQTAIFAKQIGQQTTSGAAAALWFPYDAEPADKVIPWALGSCRTLIDLAHNPDSGVSMIELRQFSRTEKIHIPDWAIPLGARAVVSSLPPVMSSEVENEAAVEAATRPGTERTGRERIRSLKIFKSGFSLRVPLMDTTIYLDYLANRFVTAGGSIAANTHLTKLEEVDQQFGLVINCAGIGARKLVSDADLETHR